MNSQIGTALGKGKFPVISKGASSSFTLKVVHIIDLPLQII
jgi:hypothetical protein